jgi:hypothetical protein
MPSTAVEYGLTVPQELLNLEKERSKTKPRTQERKIADKNLKEASEKYKNDPKADERFDEEKATKARDSFMSKLLNKYNGSQWKALMAYNWGAGNVDNWLKKGSPISEVPEETLGYLAKILKK